MVKSYTQDAKQRCFALIDSDLENIWNGIALMPTDTDAEKWEKKLRTIAREYVFSSRFALMRIFLGEPGAVLMDPTEPSRGFTTVLSDGSTCRIENITQEHAQQMTEEDLFSLQRLLLDRASTQSGYNRVEDGLIIKKALSPMNGKTALLTREEAFHLGHILRFTLQEMEWFLLRVFDTEDGFRFHTSNDLIEAYGFLTGSSSGEVAKIKAAYEKSYGRAEKVDCDEKADGWTMDVGGSLPEKVRAWSVFHSNDRDGEFLKWLGQRAAYLDLPSKTALRIYRNLAVYTHNLAVQKEGSPDVDNKKLRKNGRYETDFVRSVREAVEMADYADQTREALFEGDRISPEKCKQIADALLLENLDFAFSNQKDKAKAWHVVQVMTDGRMTVSGGVNQSRTRVRDILSGKIARVEKSDMLYLLWFASNLCWFDGKNQLNAEDIANRLNDFIDASEACLNAAGLPGFYPPHLIEQSMMLSIVCAFAGPEKCDPAELYESICSSLIVPRMRGKNGGNKS